MVILEQFAAFLDEQDGGPDVDEDFNLRNNLKKLAIVADELIRNPHDSFFKMKLERDMRKLKQERETI